MATQANTVFSTQVAVAEPAEVVVAPARCEEGANLLHAWATAVKNADKLTWEDAFGKGYKPYLKHMVSCNACLTYEMSKHSRIPTPATEERKS